MRQKGRLPIPVIGMTPRDEKDVLPYPLLGGPWDKKGIFPGVNFYLVHTILVHPLMCEALMSLQTSEETSGEVTILLETSPEVSN